jgi:membrane protease YdiL (CAAX protease family)
MDALVYDLALAAICFAGFLALKYCDKRLTYVFGFLFAVYVAVDDQITGLGWTLLRFIHAGYWNWSGKICSLLLSLVVILALRMSRESTGLVLPRRNVRIGAIALVPLVLLGVVLGHVYKPEAPSAETFAFQLLMPGTAEELTYRGIAPALLLGLVHGRNPPAGIPWAVICIAAIPYSVVHGLSYSHGAFAFDLSSALWTLSGGLVYGWLRFSTGSLLFPVLAHSLTNVAFQLTPLLGSV